MIAPTKIILLVTVDMITRQPKSTIEVTLKPSIDISTE